MTKPGKIIEKVKIEDYAAEAKCVARIDGRVIFVDHVAPGDVADIKIIRKKKNFLQAVPTHFHTYSGHRQDPFCEHYGECGGCKWQHIRYEKQLEFKSRQVRDQLERIGHHKDIQLEPILGSASEIRYRNKLEYTFSNTRWLTKEEIDSGQEFDRNGLGFHKPGAFDKVLDINSCFLQDDNTNRIRLAVKKYAIENDIPFYDLKEHTGFLRNLIVRNSNTGEWMVILQVKYDEQKWISGILSELRNKFPFITSLFYIINPKGNESYQDQEAIHFSGEKYIKETMEDLVFRVGPKSFFQTNSAQAFNLYNLVREYADIQTHEVVYDLYTGTGSISVFVARNAKKVIGIEYVEEAITDARINADVNDIGNVVFYAGDIKDVFDGDLMMKHGRPDVIITDPPRAGMHKDVISQILEAEPARIVYVSCNPATQARDTHLLEEKYRLIKSRPVDMFPHTHHIENVALLKLNKNE